MRRKGIVRCHRVLSTVLFPRANSRYTAAFIAVKVRTFLRFRLDFFILQATEVAERVWTPVCTVDPAALLNASSREVGERGAQNLKRPAVER